MDARDVQSIPLFAGLSKDDQKVVAQYADEVDVDAGKVLAQEGRLAYEFFAIKEGTADVTLGGEVRGRVTSGGYGYSVGASIAYAYLPAADAQPGTAVAVEVFGEWIEGEVRAEPLLDPAGDRVRA